VSGESRAGVPSVQVSGAPSEGQGKDSNQRAEGTFESENQRLQTEVERLEDANHMLMENLANCAEENEQLSEKLAASAPPKPASQRELELIESIRKALSVPSGLEFLSRLNEEQLQALLTAIKAGVK
jgi:predicted RNase H-like nuclease (RuvC/YqgF family)